MMREREFEITGEQKERLEDLERKYYQYADDRKYHIVSMFALTEIRGYLDGRPTTRDVNERISELEKDLEKINKDEYK